MSEMDQEVKREMGAAMMEKTQEEIANHNLDTEDPDEGDSDGVEPGGAVDRLITPTRDNPFPKGWQRKKGGGLKADKEDRALTVTKDIDALAETDGEGKVLDIAAKAKKIDRASALRLFKLRFLGRHFPEYFIPAPPAIYGAVSDNAGGKFMIEIKWLDQAKSRATVRRVVDQAIRSSVAKYFAEDLAVTKTFSDFGVYKSAEVTELTSLIIDGAPAYDESQIAATAERNAPGLAYHRLPFDLIKPAWVDQILEEKDENGKELDTLERIERLRVKITEESQDKNPKGCYPATPVFDELLSRMTNQPAVMAFIGSLLENDSSRAQSLIMFGKGGNGKGRLLSALGKIFEGSHAASSTDAAKSQFFKGELVGARLLTFGECDDFKFPVSDLMKGITGDDTHTINIKNQPQFTTTLKCKVMYATNRVPKIQRTESNIRRVIFSQVSPLPVGTKLIGEKAFDRLLWAEAQGWLSKAWAYYRVMCPDHAAIPNDQGIMEALVAEGETEFSEIMERYFIIDDTKRIGMQFNDIGALFQKLGMPAGRKYEFKEYLENAFGIVNSNQKRIDDKERVIQAKRLYGVVPTEEAVRLIGRLEILRPVEYRGDQGKEEWWKVLRVYWPDMSNF